MSKLEKQTALPRRSLFRIAAELLADDRYGVRVRPKPKRKAKKAKGKR